MLIRFLCLVTLCMTAICAEPKNARAQGTTRSQSDFTLERGRAGTLVLGMTVNALYDRVPGEDLQLVANFAEGHFRPLLEIKMAGFDKGPALTAVILEHGPCGEDYSIWGVTVHDPRFRTKDGLGVGSTLGEIRRVYSGAKVGNIDADGGPSVVIFSEGMTFGMEPQLRYTDRSRVKSVWIVPQAIRDIQRKLCPSKLGVGK